MSKTTFTVPAFKKCDVTYVSLPHLCLLLHAHADGYESDGNHTAALVIHELARGLSQERWTL